jgi:hypothetical protein
MTEPTLEINAEDLLDPDEELGIVRPDPAGRIEVDQAKPFRRMKPAKTVQEGQATSGDPLTRAMAMGELPPLTGEAAEKYMREYNKGVLERHAKVAAIFEGVDEKISPVKSPEYLKYLQSQLSYANMVWVITGTFPQNATTGSIKDDPTLGLPDVPAGLGGNPAVDFAIRSGLILEGESPT